MNLTKVKPYLPIIFVLIIFLSVVFTSYLLFQIKVESEEQSSTTQQVSDESNQTNKTKQTNQQDMSNQQGKYEKDLDVWQCSLSGSGPTLDDKYVKVAKQVPGFGGAYLEGNILYINLIETTKLSQAKKAFVEVLGQDRVPAGGVRAVQGKYDFCQLQIWRKNIDKSGFNINITDNDERANKLSFGVGSTDDVSRLRQEIDRLVIPQDAVIVEVQEPPTPQPSL